MMASLLKQELETLRQDPTWITAPLVLSNIALPSV